MRTPLILPFKRISAGNIKSAIEKPAFYKTDQFWLGEIINFTYQKREYFVTAIRKMPVFMKKKSMLHFKIEFEEVKLIIF